MSDVLEEFLQHFRIGALGNEDWEEHRARLEERWACDHPVTQLCYRVNVAGSRYYSEQCQRCGTKTKVVRKADIAAELLAELPQFDEALGRSWQDGKYAEWRQVGLAEAQAKQERWWASYEAHLKSAEWRALRQKVLARAKGTCEGCGDRAPRQVHHLTYNRVGNEMLFDLVAVCNNCHQACHPGKDLGGGGDD